MNGGGTKENDKTGPKTSRTQSFKKPGPVYREKMSKSSAEGDMEDEEEMQYWEIERIQRYSRDPENGEEKYDTFSFLVLLRS